MVSPWGAGQLWVPQPAGGGGCKDEPHRGGGEGREMNRLPETSGIERAAVCTEQEDG